MQAQSILKWENLMTMLTLAVKNESIYLVEMNDIYILCCNMQTHYCIIFMTGEHDASYPTNV